MWFAARSNICKKIKCLGLKGTVSRDFLLCFFFFFLIKQLLLVPLNCRERISIFLKFPVVLFLFVIDSPAYSPTGSQDSSVYSPPQSRDSPVYASTGIETPRWWIHWGVGLQLVYKKSCWCKIHQGVDNPLLLIHWGVFTPWSLCHQKVSL